MVPWKDVTNPSSRFNRNVRNDLASQGYELTPQELVDQRKVILEKIRAFAKAKGHNLPESDEELFRIIMSAAKRLLG